MEHAVVHRIVEQHAATHGDTPAIVQTNDIVTYRDLNQRGNAVARHLSGQGFRRGGHAIVSMPAGVDAATVLLAVLKCGGAYTWESAVDVRRTSVAIADHLDTDAPHRVIEITPVLRQPMRPGPNLPVLTRPTDIACILSDDEAQPLLVPHSTLTSLRRETVSLAAWEGQPNTFDLWAGLLTGATLVVDVSALREAA